MAYRNVSNLESYHLKMAESVMAEDHANVANNNQS
jgi:hypothetical protein